MSDDRLPCFCRNVELDPEPFYLARDGGPDVGEAPVGTALHMRTKDAVEFADKIDRDVENLDDDIVDVAPRREETPEELRKMAAAADKEGGFLNAALAEVYRKEADKSERLAKGKGAAQVAAERKFGAAWATWRKSWIDYMDKPVGAWRSDMFSTAKAADFTRLETWEAELLGKDGWRARFEALGYKPSKPAPTKAEVEAAGPKSGWTEAGAAIKDAAKGAVGLVPWIVGGLAVAVVGAVVVGRK